jgi:hypothetical protein
VPPVQLPDCPQRKSEAARAGFVQMRALIARRKRQIFETLWDSVTIPARWLGQLIDRQQHFGLRPVTTPLLWAYERGISLENDDG